MNFYYQIGDVTTTRRWDRPNYHIIKAFLKSCETVGLLDKYRFQIIGNVLFKINETWDLDIIISGDFENYETLENDFHEILNIGFNYHNILVDITHLNNPMSQLSKDAYYSEDTVKTQMEVTKIGYIRLESYTQNLEQDLRKDPYYKKVSKYLVTRKRFWPDPLWHKNIDQYLNSSQNKKLYEALEFINSTPEEFFGDTNK